MISTVEWASIHYMLKPHVFMMTKVLYELEVKRVRPGRDWLDSLHQTRRWEYPWLLSTMQPWNKTDVVIDAGCSNTAWPVFIANGGCDVIGFDVDAIAILDAIDLCKVPNVAYEVRDIRDTKYPSGIADKVTCISVLEHFPRDEWKAGLAELLRITKRGGKVGITLDISLSNNDSLRQVELMMMDYGVPIPGQPPDAIVYSMADVPPYLVLGMVLTKEGI